ncbi:MAG TPA: hypothetical protein VF375_05285 [Candidatus Limnocylindrales bacterium]
MGSLIRADWLRIRRRGDVWISVLGIPAMALLAYVTGALSAGNAQIQTVGDLPPEFRQQFDAQIAAQHAFAALPYQFPRSIATMVEGTAMWLLLGAAFLAASLLGNEFSWGTIRNVALIQPGRLRYLAVRLAWLVALVLVAFVAVTALGAIAPAIIRVDPGDPSALTQDPSLLGGFPFGPSAPVSIGGALIVAASLLCLALAGMALVGLTALTFRSAASGILAAGAYVIVEGIAAALVMSRATGDLRYLPQLGLTMRLAGLVQDAQVAAGLISADGNPASSPGWVALPPLVGAAILAVWLGGLLGLWFVVLRRADINE